MCNLCIIELTLLLKISSVFTYLLFLNYILFVYGFFIKVEILDCVNNYNFFCLGELTSVYGFYWRRVFYLNSPPQISLSLSDLIVEIEEEEEFA